MSLAQEHVIQYIPRKKTPFLTFVQEREHVDRIFLSKEAYDERKEKYVRRVKSVLDYAKEENICRSQILLHYFDEKNAEPCGKCDICQQKREKELSNREFQTIRNEIEKLLQNDEYTTSKLINILPFKEDKIMDVLRYLMDNQVIRQNEQMKMIFVK